MTSVDTIKSLPASRMLDYESEDLCVRGIAQASILCVLDALFTHDPTLRVFRLRSEGGAILEQALWEIRDDAIDAVLSEDWRAF